MSLSNVFVFEFESEWGEDTDLDESGYRGIIKLGDREVGCTPNLLWDKQAAIEAAQDLLIERVTRLLAPPTERQ